MTTESFRFNFLPHLAIHVRKFQERSIFLKGSTAVCKNYAAQKKNKNKKTVLLKYKHRISCTGKFSVSCWLVAELSAPCEP